MCAVLYVACIVANGNFWVMILLMGNQSGSIHERNGFIVILEFI